MNAPRPINTRRPENRSIRRARLSVSGTRSLQLLRFVSQVCAQLLQRWIWKDGTLEPWNQIGKSGKSGCRTLRIPSLSLVCILLSASASIVFWSRFIMAPSFAAIMIPSGAMTNSTVRRHRRSFQVLALIWNCPFLFLTFLSVVAFVGVVFFALIERKCLMEICIALRDI